MGPSAPRPAPAAWTGSRQGGGEGNGEGEGEGEEDGRATGCDYHGVIVADAASLAVGLSLVQHPSAILNPDAPKSRWRASDRWDSGSLINT
ncbi:hypothetical protein LBMAG42_55000 [Deltaproteobacteria bacterium]|nr:hypothetical protein LBMAG42_55000 [Deltaproteobacteria bacterium]